MTLRSNPLPKDYYDTLERIFCVNGYTFRSSSDLNLYLIQQCAFTKMEAAQFIVSLPKV